MDRIPPTGGTALHQERLVRIIIVGAGPSGLLLAYKLQRSFRNIFLNILEQSPDIAGIWGQPFYPGCASNLPSANFAYAFAPRSEPWHSYASGEDTRQYFTSFAAKHELLKYVRVNHRVVGAQWHERRGCWEINVKQPDLLEHATFQCDMLIDACGYLRQPKYPKAQGIGRFQGVLVHSANWTGNVELRGQNVALIGSGASGVQILPAIQSLANQVTFFVRSQICLLPPLHDGIEKPENRTLDTQDAIVRDKASRAANEVTINRYYSDYFGGCPVQAQALTQYNLAVNAQLPPHVRRANLLAGSGANRRRLVAGKAFLKALTAPNVTVVPTGVSSLLPNGCLDYNEIAHTGIDVIICATGHDSPPSPPFQVLGRDGTDLESHCHSHPRSYLGMASDCFPNYFTLLGAFSPTANGTILPALEAQAEYIVSIIDRYQSESNMHSVAPKAEAVEDFLAQWTEIMAKKPWLHHSAPARSGENAGELPFIWPGTTMHYLEAIKEVRYEDWDIRYKGNRFAFLGDGISQAEVDPRADLAWYLTDEDVSPFASRRKRREVATRTTRK